jgi:signal transduction histidine kinase
MDGFETASLIRKRRKSAHTPIIFLTAFNDDINAAQGYASGAVDYLPTPVMPEILKTKVRVFIELSQMREQAALQAEERARRQVAEEADHRKDEFLGMLAHELRNPLGPIRNAVHLLQMMGAAEPRTRHLHEIIDRQVSHMARLIDDLLDATRLARGQILLRKDPACDLCQVVRQTAEDYHTALEASGISMAIDMPDKPVYVDGDPTRLVQAIGNLLHNAQKFTDRGGTVGVSLTHDRDAGTAVIAVRDTGIGIPPDILPQIFEVFRQAEQGLDRHRGGLGLGLALVKGLTELHGGSVRAESNGPGMGATFVITLPVRLKTAAPGVEANAQPAQKMAVQRILLIEDNRDGAESARLLLSEEGHEVRIAYNGPEGLAAAQEFLPSVILCDIGLPGMDGYQIAQAIRQNPTLSSAFIVALTGYGREEDRRLALEAGFDLHMTKPIDHVLLRHTLAHAVRSEAERLAGEVA